MSGGTITLNQLENDQNITPNDLFPEEHEKLKKLLEPEPAKKTPPRARGSSSNSCCIEKKKQYTLRYTWGTQNLNESLAILKRGIFAIVGASRNSGKTTYTFDIACKNALLGHKVLYLSLEMGENELKESFARKYAGITVKEEYYYEIPPGKQNAFERKMNEINSIQNLFFRGMRRGSGKSWEDILDVINEFTELDLIFIDNLDLISGRNGENELVRQKRITETLMGFTKEYEIPVILIHHHRKKIGTTKKDHGSDELSGSGKIGDGADYIFKIERCVEPDAPYPLKYETKITQQKGRGYDDVGKKAIYFISGTFVDRPPLDYKTYNDSLYETADQVLDNDQPVPDIGEQGRLILDAFGGKVIS